MARGGMTGIQLDKVHVYSSDESLDKLLETFEKVMAKYGQSVEKDDDGEGEDGSFNVNELDEETEEEQVAALIEEEEHETKAEGNPWDLAAKRMKEKLSNGSKG